MKKPDYIYTARFTVSKPCDVIGCSCNFGTRYIAYSYKPTKQELIKVEPHVERVELSKKEVGQSPVWTIAFKRLHAGINGRRKDSFSTYFGVFSDAIHAN